MKLDDFISETISQIINGIKKANEFAKENGGKIDASNLGYTGSKGGGGIIFFDISTREIVQNIEFDIAVTANDTEKGKSGIGVFIGSIGLGTQIENGNENTIVNRIKFSIPLYLPKK